MAVANTFWWLVVVTLYVTGGMNHPVAERHPIGVLYENTTNT